ncbi:DUF6882 domain-containing protein [Bacillus toyonensis]|uniref:DUF6882 domain-containing protein n=1 Tax=Bacillus toyonensis TaxID=155322 RepID=UPI000279613F|nr:DUF6882 domain-containing protein [Bacillus toyonensis]KNH41965.1 hypothetical protein ACS75_04155 [Bacillus thuringiensis]EJQ77011.1 hypothetical protein IGO_05745 [Bacillus toyonensis]MCH5455705.1 hypothetical protein [Bacillus toyonensis]MCU4830953.1 hypothetical protein [Bacillus toyonensis]HDR3500200.1 hypothetical protein [Bacillus toyonensis]
MSMTDEQFDKFLDYCYENLAEKQKKLLQEYAIGTFDEYWYDQEESILQFKSNNQVKLEFNVIFIGSWSKKSDSWMWSWANKSMTDNVRNNSLKIKELQQLTGFDIFANPSFECNESTAHELTAFAVEHLQAKGMYISPNGQTELYMAIMSTTTR